MAVNLVTITGSLKDLTGTAPDGGKLWFKINRPDWNSTGNIFTPQYVEAEADDAGLFSIALQTTADFEAGSYYTAILKYDDVTTGRSMAFDLGSFEVPDVTSAHLSDLLQSNPIPPDFFDARVTAVEEGLAAEIARATAAETALDDAIEVLDAIVDANSARLTAVETEVDVLTVSAAFGIPTFADTAAGVAGVANGALFSVVGTGEFILYRRVDAAAVEVVRLPTTQRLTDLADCRVILRNATASANMVTVNRQTGKIYFPRLEVAFPNNLIPTNPLNITPVGGASALFELDFSLNVTSRIHYYADMDAGTVVAVDAIKPSIATGVLVPLGSSHNGSFNNFRGFRFVDAYDELGRITSIEGMQRTSENVPTIGVQTGRIPFVVNTAKWFQLQPVYADMRYLCNAAAKLDLSYMTDGTTATIICTNTLQLFAGNGRTFVGTAHNSLGLTIGGAVRVTRVSDYILAEPLAGTPTFSTITHPVMEITILQAGQSQHVQGHQYGLIGGFSEGSRDVDWMNKGTLDQSRFWINGATGGTALLRDSLDTNTDPEANPDAWWYDDDFETDGPALLNCYAQIDAAIALGQPVPEVVFWAQGESDAGALQTASNGVTQARYAAAINVVLTKIRNYLIAEGASNPQFIVTMLGSWDGSALRFSTGAIRRSYIEFCAATAWAHQGPEMFDLPRFYRQIHMNEMGNYVHGKRLLRHYANVFIQAIDNQYPEGPVCGVAVPGADGRSVTIPITSGGAEVVNYPRGDVAQFISIGVNQNIEGGAPFGFAIINTDTRAARRINAEISGDNIILRTDVTLTANDRVFFPAGYMPEKARFQFIWDNQLDRRTNTPGLPLRSYVSAPLA